MVGNSQFKEIKNATDHINELIIVGKDSQFQFPDKVENSHKVK